MSRPSSSPSIQLFPFLAVLVCAMGALILLLLITACKMREAVVARAYAAQDAAEEAARQKPKPAPAGPTPQDLAAKAARRVARLRSVEEAKKRQALREQEWKRGVAEAEMTLDQRRQRAAQSRRELTELQEKLQATETNLQHLLKRKIQVNSELEKDTKLRAKVEKEHAELSESITAAQKKLAEVRRAQATAASKFAFIPYDGASGTTRRPLYIECTSTGIRFQPENELLDESDLKGFTETFNPLLVASQRLMQYWREQSIATDDPKRPSRPYVLLLVRPKGTIAYYVARKMLSQLGEDFGYELIEDDFPLQLPPADPMAKAVIRGAVADTLKDRGEMLASGGRIGGPRLGEVLLGRSEEPIEFGTLDDQVAAKVAKDESPFRKNSGGQGKSFTITRSPVHKDEVSSGSFKSSLAERERRRSQGVPDSLASMVGRGEGTDSGGNGRPGNGSDFGGPGGNSSAGDGSSGAGSGGDGSSGDGSSRSATGARGTGIPGTTGSTQAATGLAGSSAGGSGAGGAGGSGSNGSGANGGGQASGAGGAQSRAFATAYNSSPNAPASRGSSPPDTPTGYHLGDPFSREHKATGRNGAGTADSPESRGEKTAGDASGTAASGSAAGRTGSRSGTGNATGVPSGARAGKVIDIPASGGAFEAASAGSGGGTGARGTGSPGIAGRPLSAGDASTADYIGNIGNSSGDADSQAFGGPGGTASGATQQRALGTSPRGGAAGGQPLPDGIPSDFVPGGGGEPGVMSSGTSSDPTAPRGRGPTGGTGTRGSGGSGSSGGSAGGNPANEPTAADFEADPNVDFNAQDGGNSGNYAGSSGGRTRSGGARRGSAGSNGGGASGGVIDDEEDNAFRKPQTPEADSIPGADEPAAGSSSGGQPGMRGQRGGKRTRSTNPEPQERTYGDNPEARKQLAKAASGSSPSAISQKRESARRRWGGSNTGQIGFERKVNVQLSADRVIIGKDDIEVIIEPGTTQDELVEAILSALDEHSQAWGKPPTRFYWVPFLHFDVYIDGNKEYERLHGPLRDWGIYSEVDFKKGNRPSPAPQTDDTEKGLILPVSEASKGSNKTADTTADTTADKTQAPTLKSTKKKLVGPSEKSADPISNEKPAPVKKSPFSWFKRLGTSR